MTPLEKIESLTGDYAASRSVLAGRLASLQAEIDRIKRQKMASIKKELARVKAAHTKLYAAIEANSGAFVKPRTRTFFNVKVGYQKGKGRIELQDSDRTIELIRKNLPDMAEALIRKFEEPVKAAIQNLSVDDLKKIGGSVKDADDQVVIKPVDDETGQIVKALLEEAEQELAADSEAESRSAAGAR